MVCGGVCCSSKSSNILYSLRTMIDMISGKREATVEQLEIENAALKLLLQKLTEENTSLKLLLQTQAIRISELEKRLNKNSGNSSKPPSSDGLRKNVQNNREKSGKKPGGQLGHKGETLKLKQEPDRIIAITAELCNHCNCNIAGNEVIGIEKRQIHDIPEAKILVTEYQAEKKICACGYVTTASFPNEAISQIQYGSRIKGFALYLQNEQKIPYDRCTQILSDYYNTSFSEGSLFNAQESAHANLQQIEEQTKDALLTKQVLHFDETGMQVNKKLHWLHVASNSELTLYSMHEKRGKEAMDVIGILPKFTGTSIHDHLKSYYLYTKQTHGLCNAHHLRELKSFEEENQIWAKKMRILLQELCHQVNEAKRRNETFLPKQTLQELRQQYREIIIEGDKELPVAIPPPTKKRGRIKQPKGRNLMNRLRDYEQDVLRFAFSFDTPFTNNQAERDLRMMKLKQKISGCFRSTNGARMFARICGYISTLRKQGINISDAMTRLAAGTPIVPRFW